MPTTTRSRLTDRAATTAVVALVVAGDFEFRRRDLHAATSGSVDVAIAVELLVSVIVGAWLLLSVARPPRGRRLPAPLPALWGLALVLAASAAWAPSPLLAISRAFQLLVATGLVTAIAARARPGTWYRIAHGYVATVSVAIAIGVGFRKVGDSGLQGRFLWLYGHPVVSASMLVVSVLLLLGLLSGGGAAAGARRWSSPLYAGLLLAHTVALFATRTRGSIVALVAGLAVFVLIRQRRAARHDTMLLATLAAAPIGLALLPVIEAVALRGESVEQLRTLNSRAQLWVEAWRALRGHLLLGRGYFSSRELFLDTIGLGGAHNAYLEVLLSAGLVGAGLLLMVLVQTTRRLATATTHPDRPVLAAVFTALLVNGLTAQYFAQSGTTANLLLLLVVAWVAMLPTVTAPQPPAGEAARPLTAGEPVL